MAINTFPLQRSLSQATSSVERSFSRLASGKRISSPSDDPAGLAISQQLAATVTLSRQGQRNTGDGISATEIAAGAVTQLSDIAVRMSELSAQSANGTYSTEQRAALDQEFQALSQESQRIIETTGFNGVNLLGGGGTAVQAGPDGGKGSVIAIPGVDGQGIASSVTGLSIATEAGAKSSLDTLSSVIQSLSGEAAKQGAVQNRLATAGENLATLGVTIEAARSRVQDVDVASEAANLSLASNRRQVTVALQRRYQAQGAGLAELVRGQGRRG